jgi:hypothetical protein
MVGRVSDNVTRHLPKSPYVGLRFGAKKSNPTYLTACVGLRFFAAQKNLTRPT